VSKRKTHRYLYRFEWYDIEADAGWGEGADQPPLVIEPAFILSWPRKSQEVPSYKICHAWVEGTPGMSSVVPACVVKGKPEKLMRMEMRYR
jgi:hypothetical protein